VRLAWRVACVRIPRFAIGAVWERVVGDAARSAEYAPAQLELPVGGYSAPALASGAYPPGALAAAVPRTWPLAAHWDERPVALAERDDDRVRAVTAAAARLRVRVGMTVTEARELCPELEALPWDEEVVQRAVTRTSAALVIASSQLSPVAGAPGMWWVEASQSAGVAGERSLVRTLLRIARLWHPRARVAVASSCVAARAATWADVGQPSVASGRGPEDESLAVIVPRGGCAAYLAPAPLGFIPMDDDLRARLLALGVRTAGALAALDGGDVQRRWGEGGVRAWRLARGEDFRRPVLAAPDAPWSVHVELAMPVSTAEAVGALVLAALERLGRMLAVEGRAMAAVAITLTLDDGRGARPAGGVPRTITREVRLPRATSSVAAVFTRCRALLERWPLAAPVCGVAVAVAAGRGSGQDRAAVPASVVAELRAELGENVEVVGARS